MEYRIFKNLNKGCLSAIPMSGPYKGKVVAHLKSAYLNNVKFVVSEASRQRVIKESCKNVHAWAQGTLKCCELITLRYPIEEELPEGRADHEHSVKIRYNPYLKGHFFFADNEEPVFNVGCAEITEKGVFTE